MPLKCSKKVRYRFTENKVRLAFCGNKVVEAKSFKSKLRV